MKKKVALLLAVVMVMSLLPMNLFGARPGSMRDPRNAPVWNIAPNTAPSQPTSDYAFTFRIDANALSNLSLDTGAMAVLDFTLEGGANASEVGFASGLVGGTFTSSAAVQFHFHAGPNFRVEGETAGNTEFFNHLNSIANTRANQDFLSRSRPGSNGWAWNATARENNFPAAWVHADFYRTVQVNLFGAAWGSIAGSIPGELPTLEGWIDVTIAGMRASEDDAAMSIYLREGEGTRTPRSVTLVDGVSMFTGWGNGVNITAASVVPMSGVAVLSGIRIREEIVGRILSPEPGTTNNGFHVRLVAPRGFRWDADPLLGYTRDRWDAEGNLVGGLRAEGNTSFAARNNEGQHADQWEVEIVSLPAASGIATNPFVNENTNRNELILRVNTSGRGTTFTARTQPAEVTLRGLSLIPLRNAATTGNVAIDVYVGDVLGAPGHLVWSGGQSLGAPNPRLDSHGSGSLGHVTGSPAQTWRHPAGSWWTERTNEASHWRTTGLVVATLDFEGELNISGPAAVQEVRSGGWSVETRDLALMNEQSGLAFADTDRWLNGGNHTIRIAEVIQGNLFRTLDRYELVPAVEGVRIVDARIRAGRDGENADTFSWGNFIRPDFFIPALHEFNDDGSVSFATRPANPEAQSRLRRMDIALMISVEAGFEAKHGSDVDVRVYRNGFYEGTATIATAYDPITVTQSEPVRITRNAFDVLALTPVAGFTITEAEYGLLDHGYELRFALQAVQNGREVNFGQLADMQLWLGEPSINEDSGFELRELRDDDIIGFEVRSTSHGTPAVITFDEVYVAGPTVPGIEWHVVVYGPEISANSDLILGDTDYFDYAAGRGITNRRDFDDEHLLSDYALRGRFYNMPYDALVLEVGGMAVIDDPAPPGLPGVHAPGAFQRRMFTTASMVNVDGVYIQAVAFPTVAPGIASSMINPRVFADFIGASVEWNEVARTASFTGMDRGGQSQTVVLTLDSPVAMVNGNPVDIATGAGQGALAGNIQPVVIGGRSYVPARFLATIFGVPIEGDGRTVTLG
ncbi:MAG: copper amine oxidase N-terminal domain-containing protein [Defluviitaleaceae bacterium]|nr:copper amine oxidase N-terminal domain-containing protein [Defluviitaleaceae bacterium]MCL2262355.1 copper amine oxidase N-terminal domain-containing protein [Defluviitaleaceae bacterium]